MRFVPDHQEVWTSQRHAGLALVVELNQRSCDVDDDAVAEFYFSDLLKEDEGVRAEFPAPSVTRLAPDAAPCLAPAAGIGATAGQTLVGRYSTSGSLGCLAVHLAVLRLRGAAETDVVVVAYAPARAAPDVDALLGSVVRAGARSLVVVDAGLFK